jgi:hypothetical protein
MAAGLYVVATEASPLTITSALSSQSSNINGVTNGWPQLNEEMEERSKRMIHRPHVFGSIVDRFME